MDILKGSSQTSLLFSQISNRFVDVFFNDCQLKIVSRYIINCPTYIVQTYDFNLYFSVHFFSLNRQVWNSVREWEIDMGETNWFHAWSCTREGMMPN